MTNGTNYVENTEYVMPKTEHLTPVSKKIVLAETPVELSDGLRDVFIRGMTQVAAGDTLGAGEFKEDSSDATHKTFTFAADDTIGEVEVLYNYVETAMEAKIDNKTSAVGEAVLAYPVYGGAASECDVDSSIIGYVILKVFRARVTAQPGLDGSYKSAGTYQFTLATLDPKRDDDAVYSIAYIKDPDLF